MNGETVKLVAIIAFLVLSGGCLCYGCLTPATGDGDDADYHPQYDWWYPSS